MEKIKEKLNLLRQEADQNLDRAEEAEEKIKKLEQDSMLKEQEIQTLQHKLNLAETDNDQLETRFDRFERF